ncbi:MAG: SURF1 family cytochrome oxidase biogenesis protein [Henriciella sp.]
MRFQPLPVMTVLAVLSVFILISLGNWQYTRYADKAAAGTLQEAGLRALTVNVQIDQDNPRPVQNVYGAIDSEPVWRRYVAAESYEHDGWVLVMVGATGGPQPVPLTTTDLPHQFVERYNQREIDAFQKNPFAAANEPENNLWYWLDVRRMAERLGFDEAPVAVLEPIEVTIQNSDQLDKVRRSLNPYAFGADIDSLPPERHFGYALTWWGIAISLIGVYLAFHHSRGRLRFRS